MFVVLLAMPSFKALGIGGSSSSDGVKNKDLFRQNFVVWALLVLLASIASHGNTAGLGILRNTTCEENSRHGRLLASIGPVTGMDRLRKDLEAPFASRHGYRHADSGSGQCRSRKGVCRRSRPAWLVWCDLLSVVLDADLAAQKQVWILSITTLPRPMV